MQPFILTIQFASEQTSHAGRVRSKAGEDDMRQLLQRGRNSKYGHTGCVHSYAKCLGTVLSWQWDRG